MSSSVDTKTVALAVSLSAVTASVVWWVLSKVQAARPRDDAIAPIALLRPENALEHASGGE